jgi:hypothetical protein
MAIANSPIRQLVVRSKGDSSCRLSQERPRVDGKLLMRGGQRFRVRGVTYGPFAPGPDGHQFPAPECVVDDFARMADIGVNAVRTYHVPPGWLLDLADESGLVGRQS